MDLEEKLIQELNNKVFNISKNLDDDVRNFSLALTGFSFDIEEFQRIYLKTSIVQSFVNDNPSQCDIGSISNTNFKVLQKKHSFRRR